ncbi:zinc finger BED domain-containing protein 1-like [Rhizophagus clarus]|uniref:Zinc finger BED domain-containing protein 1-like n=1 Tax=Rhizophagus clarus TaxID=94130 RepID=A0A8H3QN66_9GLOM|nr:zinc finger BED domain-containing protein 1-like [Rhizophagus clarus]
MTEHQETNTIKPIHVVKSADLKMLFKELDPGFIMPCQKSIRNIIDDAFDYTSPQLKTLMKNEATSVSLTLDLWTSKSRQGYLGITCTFIDSQWKLKELTLTIEYIRYPHTAEHILETLESVLEEWEIRDKVYTITTDNVVGKDMIPAQVLIMRAKRLIDFFMCPKQSERLEIIQKKFSDIAKNTSNKEININGLEEEDEEIYNLLKNNSEFDVSQTSDYLNVIADVTTCWNSSFLAWQRLLKLKDYINLLISTLLTKLDPDSKKDCKRLKQIMLQEQEWDTIKDLVSILKPFAEATNYLGGNKYCTYTIIVPTLIKIINRLKPSTADDEKYMSEINFKNLENIFDDQISIEDDEKEKSNPTAIRRLKINDPANTKDLVKKIKLTLYAAMKHYWKNLIAPEVLLPSLLDPRIKDLSFVSVKERFDAEELLNDEYDQEKLKSLSSSTSIQDDDKSQEYDSIFASFKMPASKEINEITEYFSLKKINFESDPLVWWHGQEENFPILSKIAKKYLAVYACSTSSERLFSDAGNLLTAKRNRMSPKFFKKIMFLKRNGIHVDSIHKQL